MYFHFFSIRFVSLAKHSWSILNFWPDHLIIFILHSPYHACIHVGCAEQSSRHDSGITTKWKTNDQRFGFDCLTLSLDHHPFACLIYFLIPNIPYILTLCHHRSTSCLPTRRNKTFSSRMNLMPSRRSTQISTSTMVRHLTHTCWNVSSHTRVKMYHLTHVLKHIMWNRCCWADVLRSSSTVRA